MKDASALEWARELEQDNMLLQKQLSVAERRLLAGPVSTTGMEEDRLAAEQRRKGLVSMLSLGAFAPCQEAAPPCRVVCAPCPPPCEATTSTVPWWHETGAAGGGRGEPAQEHVRAVPWGREAGAGGAGRGEPAHEEPGLLAAEAAEWRIRLDVLNAQNERFKQQKAAADAELQRLQAQLSSMERQRRGATSAAEPLGVLQQLRQMDDETDELRLKLRWLRKLPRAAEVFSFMASPFLAREYFSRWRLATPPKEFSCHAFADELPTLAGLPSPWEVVWSDEWGSPYYWNTCTGEVAWERPAAAHSEAGGDADSIAVGSAIGSVSGTASSELWVDPGAPSSPGEVQRLIGEFMRSNRPVLVTRDANGPSREAAIEARRRARERRRQARIANNPDVKS